MRIKKVVSFAFSLVSASLILASCAVGLNPAGQSATSVTLKVSLPDNSMTDASRNADIQGKTANARFIHPDSRSISVTVAADDFNARTMNSSIDAGKNEVSITILDILPGNDRTFSVSLFNAEGTLLASGSARADIISSRANSVAVTPIPINPIVLTPGEDSFYSIPAGSGGKTFVFVMDDFGAGTYDAFVTNCRQARVSVYDQNGRSLIPGTASGFNSFTTTRPCYLAVSIPLNFETDSTFGYIPQRTIGDFGPGGGYIFYIAGNDLALSRGWKYLEVSPYSTQFDTNAAWSAGGDTVGASGTGLGSGRANTDKFIAVHTASGPYPAQLCYNLNYNGVSDWYCPSRDELELLRTSFYNNGLLTGVFYVDGDSYWTSTEVDAINAVSLSFGSGYYSAPKGSGRRTRAIRQFLY
jgi:hypothetical protein